MLGWNLAVWRLVSTFLLSLSAGYITHFLFRNGWLGNDYVRIKKSYKMSNLWTKASGYFKRIKTKINYLIMAYAPNEFNFENLSGLSVEKKLLYDGGSCCIVETGNKYTVGCCTDPPQPKSEESKSCGCNLNFSKDEKEPLPSATIVSSCESNKQSNSFLGKLLKETFGATVLVIKFMLLAFFLEALIIFYVPQSLIITLLGNQNSYSTLWAALLGVPIYTSNMAALPMIGGLLAKGMNPAAALAFLISGPTTTIPAMAAVWGLTTKKVFTLYVLYVLIGAIVFGYAYSIFSGLI